jgi:hypothetical protein
MQYLTITRNLVYYDGPQLMLGQDGRGATYLALAVPSDSGDAYRFLAVAVPEAKLEEYFNEVVDLRHVFRHPKGKRYFIVQFGTGASRRLPLEVISGVPSAWLPEAGFFASQHTEIAEDFENAATSALTIPIDGRWDMTDLAQFPNKYTDVYAFLFATEETSHESEHSAAIETAKLQEMFQRYPWGGGISTVNFYNDLYRAIPRHQRLRVREIQYASPGFIRIEANASLSEHIKSLVQNMMTNWESVRAAYDELYDGLSQRGFLGVARADIAARSGDHGFAENGCRRLAVALHFDGVSRVAGLCGDDWIATAKILLSFYRRIQDLASFYDTGKAALV